jgi:hypothetical protein
MFQNHIGGGGGGKIKGGGGSIVDPDFIWATGSGSALDIRIRTQEGQNGQHEENISFEVLAVLFWGMKTSPVAWMSFLEA